MEKAARTLSFPLPAFNHPWAVSTVPHIGLPDLHVVNKGQQIPPRRILLDNTVETRGTLTGVKPLNTERPSYPQMASEQGWQGNVVLRTLLCPFDLICFNKFGEV